MKPSRYKTNAHDKSKSLVKVTKAQKEKIKPRLFQRLARFFLP